MQQFTDTLFENVGHRLKIMAGVLFALEVLGGVIFGLYIIIDFDLYIIIDFENLGAFLLAVLAGLAAAAFTSYPLYGFGQLVEDVHAIRTGGADSHPTPASGELPGR